MSDRPLAPMDFTPSRVLTARQSVLIEERGEYLRVEHRIQTRGLELVLQGNTRSFGGALLNREMAFAKLAIINRGAPLIDNWPDIKTERDVSLGALAWRCDEANIGSLNWESEFFKSVPSAAQDRTSRQLYGGRTIFVEIAEMVGFGAITRQEAFRFYGGIGGKLGSETHP